MLNEYRHFFGSVEVVLKAAADTPCDLVCSVNEDSPVGARRQSPCGLRRQTDLIVIAIRHELLTGRVLQDTPLGGERKFWKEVGIFQLACTHLQIKEDSKCINAHRNSHRDEMLWQSQSTRGSRWVSQQRHVICEYLREFKGIIYIYRPLPSGGRCSLAKSISGDWEPLRVLCFTLKPPNINHCVQISYRITGLFLLQFLHPIHHE